MSWAAKNPVWPGRKRVAGVASWAVALGGMLVCAGGFGAGAIAQYPGQVAKTGKAEPVLRSVAVLEWVGEAGKPSASRMVPVAVYDGEQLNDGTIYLDRPEPLALGGGVEYELQKAGKPVGIYDVYGASDVNGAWQGTGAWRPLSVAAAAKADQSFNTSSLYGGSDTPDDDQPVLKRKHPKGTDTDTDADAGSGGAGAGADKSGAGDGGAKKSEVDPDRPELKRKTEGAGGAGGAGGSGASGDGQGTAATGADVDPDRPTLRRSHKTAAADSEVLATSNAAPDPDRPRLKRGMPAGKRVTESPRLEGLPPTMQQAVAVSDARSATEHPWKYSWANPEDETKMKTALEAIARTALGMDGPAKAAGVKPAANTAAAKALAARRAAKAKASMQVPAELADEQFRVFELAYGATATLVLTANTPAPEPAATAGSAGGEGGDQSGRPVIERGKPAAKPSATNAKANAHAKPGVKPAAQKFVTLVAQPDLYGGVLVLFKSVADSGHLDETPRMRLIDAVDAMGDNRGELLFELRGNSQRQFAMYRVLRGSAEQMFATGATATVVGSAEAN